MDKTCKYTYVDLGEGSNTWECSESCFSTKAYRLKKDINIVHAEAKRFSKWFALKSSLRSVSMTNAQFFDNFSHSE